MIVGVFDAGFDVDPDLLAGLRPPAWMRDALCAEPHYVDLPWFPEPRENSERIAEAKTVCARCLVRTECATFAAEHAITHGIWGGQSPGERSGRTQRRAERQREDPHYVRLPRAAPRVQCATCGKRVTRLHDGECWACHRTAA